MKKLLSWLLALALCLSMFPTAALAEGSSSNGQDDGVIETETQSETVPEPAEEPTSTSEPETPAEPEPSAEAESDPESTGGMTVTAVSGTSNIVGEVFANAFNDPEEDPEVRMAALQAYPTESHEPSWYEDTLRLRYLDSEGESGPNYLVYRDSFLILSEEEGQDYTVLYSMDGVTAYVSPAIPLEELEGKTGIIFLRENLGYDDILVFDGEPEQEGDMLCVPLKDTADIVITELFSDGQLEFSGDASNAEPKRAVSFTRNVEGTNWSGEITDFDASWPKASFKVDIWDLKFELILNLRFDMGFEIETTGATNGRDSSAIASVSVPLQLFNVNVDYNFQAEFEDDVPLKLKGSIATDLDVTMNLLYGTRISRCENPVTIEEFSVQRDEDYNRDVHLYLGTQLFAAGRFLELNFKIWFVKVHFGPVLKLHLDIYGGCYITARHEKDLFSDTDIGAKDVLHTCTKEGEPGCVSFHIREVGSSLINYKVDLYFKDWSFDLTNTGETTFNIWDAHNSLTFGGGTQRGVCPHELYKVPVAVWTDEAMTAPASDVTVTAYGYTAQDPIAAQLASPVTDANGRATLYLRYLENDRYTLMAERIVGDARMTGSAEQPADMVRGANETVNIVISQNEQTSIHIDHKWATDLQGKDRPASVKIAVQKKTPGTNQWTTVQTFELSDELGWSADFTGDKYAIVNDTAYILEYRAVVLDMNETAIASGDYAVFQINGYTSVADEAEPAHKTRFHVSCATSQKGTSTTITITETAVVELTLTKQWALSSGTPPRSVWLALLQKPAEGWQNNAKAAGVPDAWIPALRPFSGDANSLRNLVSARVLTVENVYSVENAPLTIGKVSEDNDWTLTYTVPKYRNGIKLQFMGTELNTGVITDLLQYEYDVQMLAKVISFGNYTARPGQAVRLYDDWQFAITVTNSDADGHTIGGSVTWVWNREYDNLPNMMKKCEYVDIIVYKNGQYIGEVRLNREDYEENNISYSDEYSTVWYWSLTDDKIEPGATYTIEERLGECEGFYGNDTWRSTVDGLDAVNYWAGGPGTRVRVQAVFEDPEAYTGPVNLRVYIDGNEVNNSRLTSDTDYSAEMNFWPGGNDVRIETDQIDGWVRVYKDPILYREQNDLTGAIGYSYTVLYLKQSDVEIDISTEWENVDASTIYPDAVEADVYQDSTRLQSVSLTQTGSEWSTAKLKNGISWYYLNRIDYEYSYNNPGTYHKYEYTAIPKPIPGFTTTVESTWDGYGHLQIVLRNTWIGPDYVNIKGKVSWEGDEGKEFLRPETVHLAVINSKEELVASYDIPVNGDGSYESTYLPGKDANGEPLHYSVLESHVNGYTARYSQLAYDEGSHTWTVDVTNTLTGYYAVTVKKQIEGQANDPDEEFTFRVQPKSEAESADHSFPDPLQTELHITGAGETKAEFVIDEDGLYLYAFREEPGENEACVYDKSEMLVLILRTTDAEGNVEFNSWVGQDGKDDIVPTDSNASDTVVFTNIYPNLTIEKNWEIDLEKLDRPDSIQVAVQKKSGDEWVTVKLVELNGDKDWKAYVVLEGFDPENGEYRVRELKEETALQELGGKLLEYIGMGKDKYDEWLQLLKTEGKSYWDGMPEEIRNAADQGYDALLEKLNATPANLYEKLMEQLSFATASARIVYDEDDEEVKGKDGDEKPNLVTYHVPERNSVVSGGTVDAHVTQYSVSYEQDGSSFTITNKAILEIDVVKRWITIGGESVISLNGDDIPDSAWLVLMCKPKAGALDNAAELAGTLGVDLGSVLSYEFPAINPIEGGIDPLNLLSQLTIGVDLSAIGKLAESFFGIEFPSLAIGKATKSNDWKVTFVVNKYSMGIPMEYKGAELSSEVIRQILKYLTGLDIPVSFNPFDNYISVPTKAIKTVEGITDPGDLLDLSKLAGAALAKAKSLTLDDIKNFDMGTLLTDYHLMANVINIQFEWEDDNILEGAKIWKDDEEDKRPDTLTIHVKDGTKEIEGSPIVLHKSDFEGQDQWTWSLELPEDADEDATYVISEEYPEGYAYKDDYTCETDGYNLTNTWHKDTFTISGQKIWVDGDNADGLRPETVTIHLYADGEEVASAVTSKEGEWKYCFPGQPRQKDGKDIVYTVAEDPVEYYKTEIDGYNVINTLVPRIYGYNVNLKGRIGLNVYLFIPQYVLQDSGLFVTLSGEQVLVADAETRTVNGLTLYRFPVDKAAKEMNDQVTVRLYRADGTLETLFWRDVDVTDTGWSYSIQTYIDRSREDKVEPLLLAVVNAMSDYGSLAQAYFQYNEENRAAVVGDVDAVTEAELAPYEAKLTEGKATGVTYAGSSLVLRSGTVIRHYFTIDEGSVGDYTFKIGSKTVTPVETEKGWMIEIPDVYARYLGKMYTIKVSSSDGTILTLKYSALSYAYKAVQDNTDPGLVKLVKALYLYNRAACAYFDSVEG